MKKLFIVTISLLFIFCGCGDRGKEITTAEDFMLWYTANKVSDSYYESHDLDYRCLYDSTLDDADISVNEDGETQYSIRLYSAPFGGSFAEMYITTTEDSIVKKVNVTMYGSVINLFEDEDDLKDYYCSILESFEGEISVVDANNVIDELFEQEGILSLSFEQFDIQLLATGETAIFTITRNE